MSVHAVESCCFGELVETYNEGLSCHWPMAFHCSVSKQGAIDGGSLIAMCLSKASKGSVDPSCLTQYTSSPMGLDFVCGRAKTLVCKPLRSMSSRASPWVMCSVGLKASSL